MGIYTPTPQPLAQSQSSPNQETCPHPAWPLPLQVNKPKNFPRNETSLSCSTGGWTQQTASFFFRKWSAPNFRTTITVVKTHLMLTIPTYYHSFSYYHTAHIELDDNHLVKQQIQNPAVSIWIKIINPSQKENHSDGAACLFPIISNE